jgi:hypothetical protein
VRPLVAPLLLIAVVLGTTVSAATVAAPAGAAELGTIATRRTVEALVHQAYPDLVFGNVACPDRVARKQGVKFTCTVQLPGTFLVVDAVQTDAKGTVTLSTGQAVIPNVLLQQFVAANASLPATVDCGPGAWRLARPGTTISCTTTLADGTTRQVQLTVNDTAGNVTITAVT